MNKYIIIVWSDFAHCPEVEKTIGPFNSEDEAKQFVYRQPDMQTSLEWYHRTGPKNAALCTIEPLTPGGAY